MEIMIAFPIKEMYVNATAKHYITHKLLAKN